jgi:hypothetical protein
MKCACALLTVLLMAAPLHGQKSNCRANPASCSIGGLSIQIAIGPAFRLTLSPATTSLISPTPTHYDAGMAPTTGPIATVVSNAPWTLSISAAAVTWSAVNTESEPARTDKPATDLKWSANAGGPFVPLTTSPATVTSGAATSGSTVSVFYQTLYSWTADPPGEYSLQVVFTISSP